MNEAKSVVPSDEARQKLSIIVPCFNEEKAIPLFFDAVQKVVIKMPLDIEYWFVNDGSSDNSLNEMNDLHNKFPDLVHFVSFSRNFGKEAAMYAGFQASTGDYVASMDVDLQDPPALLPQMYDLLKTNEYDIIGCARTDRTGENPIKTFFSDAFYGFINKISDTKIIPGARDFRMMTRQAINAVLSMKEYDRFSKGMFAWVGFRTKYLPYHNVERVAGTSKYSIKSLFTYALAGIADFSQVPLHIASWIGGISFMVSLIGILFVLIRHLINPATAIVGWASTISILLLIGGLQLLCLGIIGQYIGKIFMQVKHRPIYIVQEKK